MVQDDPQHAQKNPTLKWRASYVHFIISQTFSLHCQSSFEAKQTILSISHSIFYHVEKMKD